MSDATDTGPVLAADGRPLKRSLQRALRAEKLRALALIAPLLIFILVTFIAPIADMLFRSVENEIVSDTLPRTTLALDGWDHKSGQIPSEDVFAAFTYDLVAAAERKQHTRLGTRLNYEMTGISSLFRKTGRRVDDFGELYMDQFVDLDPAWVEPATWVTLFADPAWISSFEDWQAGDRKDATRPQPLFVASDTLGTILPETTDSYTEFARVAQTVNADSPLEETPWAPVYEALYRDLSRADSAAIAALEGPARTLLAPAQAAVAGFRTETLSDLYIDVDKDWGDPEVWATIQAFTPKYTAGYFLNAVDLQQTADGIAVQPEDQRIYFLLFKRTMFMSMMIMGSCVLLGYPIAYLLSNLSLRASNLLLILVLLPFWTSLLVRTSAWKVLLQ